MTESVRKLVEACKALLRILNTVEVIGEYEAHDINGSMRKHMRASIAVVNAQAQEAIAAVELDPAEAPPAIDVGAIGMVATKLEALRPCAGQDADTVSGLHQMARGLRAALSAAPAKVERCEECGKPAILNWGRCRQCIPVMDVQPAKSDIRTAWDRDTPYWRCRVELARAKAELAEAVGLLDEWRSDYFTGRFPTRLPDVTRDFLARHASGPGGSEATT